MRSDRFCVGRLDGSLKFRTMISYCSNCISIFLGVKSMSQPTAREHVVMLAHKGASRRRIARNELGGQPPNVEGRHCVSVWSQCTDGVAYSKFLFLRGWGAPPKTHRKWRELAETDWVRTWSDSGSQGKYLYDDPRGVGRLTDQPCSGLLRRDMHARVCYDGADVFCGP